MRHPLAIAMLTLSIAAGSSAAHADSKADRMKKDAERALREGAEATERAIRKGAKEAEKALKEGTDKIMKALDGVMRSIPQYEAPEITKDGDIIIRRKHTKPKKKEPPEGDDSTST